MNDLRELRPENRSLGDRFSRLSGTVLSINASLDLDTVLHGVVDSACALTGAARSVMTTIDRRGRLADFVTCGLSDKEYGEAFTPEDEEILAGMNQSKKTGLPNDREMIDDFRLWG